MVNLVGSYDPEVSASDSVPPGDYVAEIVGADVVPVSNNSDKGQALALSWKVDGGQYEGWRITQRIMLWYEGNNAQTVRNIAERQLAAIREATGVARPEDSSDLFYIPCKIRYGQQRNNPEYSEIKGVMSLDDEAPQGEVNKEPEPDPAPKTKAPKSNPFKKGQ